MLRNNDQYLLSNNNDDDAITVQVSDANSNLGNLLLEADWDEISEYLTTPEGQHDVDAKNDPLGILTNQSSTNNRKQFPSNKNTAFFASLFVRSPYNIIEKICNMAPSHVNQPEDLMYVLSIIPSEEEARLAELQKKVPHRTRAWLSNEYLMILHLLLKQFLSSNSRSRTSKLLDYWPSWIIGSSVTKLTPLGIAAYNPDAPSNIVQLLCTLEPEAMNKDCTYHMHTIPLIIAASSPIPPKSSDRYEHAKNERWNKVKLLTLSKIWYVEQKEVLLKTGDKDSAKTNPLHVQPAPEPTIQQIQYACEEAMKRNEWELVREFMKQYCSGEDANMNKECTNIQTTLAKHDEKMNAIKQRREKSHARDQWLHKNMGLVMYPIDAVMDLVSVVMPTSNSSGEIGIVSRMS